MEELRTPGLRTPAYMRYVDERSRILRSVLFANLFAAAIPFLSERSSELHPELMNLLSEPRLYKGYFDDPPDFQRFLSGLIVSRSVDNFHTYISEALLDVFKARPETLRSGKKVEVREVLECESIEEFAGLIAERRIEELSHEGFPSMQRYLVERLGIDVELDQEELRSASEATAIRNVVVHNRGYVNARFLRDTGRKDLSVGDPLELEMETVEEFNQTLRSIANKIDVGLLDKFGLRPFFAYEVKRDPSGEEPTPPRDGL